MVCRVDNAVQIDWRDSFQNVTEADVSEKAQQANFEARSQLGCCPVYGIDSDSSHGSNDFDWSECREEMEAEWSGSAMTAVVARKPRDDRCWITLNEIPVVVL